jgi:putative oxidoreductase
MQSTIFLIGRLLLGGFFLYSGYNHFKGIAMMTGYVQSKGIPMPKIAVAFTGLLLLVGGFSIVLGIYPAIGAFSLALFLLPTTLMMHAFWKVEDPMARMGERINFTKNMALLGAALLILSIPEPWSTRLF